MGKRARSGAPSDSAAEVEDTSAQTDPSHGAQCPSTAVESSSPQSSPASDRSNLVTPTKPVKMSADETPNCHTQCHSSENVKIHEDVAEDSPAHRLCKFKISKNVYSFIVNGEHLQVTVLKSGGCHENAARISRLCWAKMDAGASKDETLAYRDLLYRQCQSSQNTEDEDECLPAEEEAPAEEAHGDTEASAGKRKAKKRKGSQDEGESLPAVEEAPAEEAHGDTEASAGKRKGKKRKGPQDEGECLPAVEEAPAEEAHGDTEASAGKRKAKKRKAVEQQSAPAAPTTNVKLELERVSSEKKEAVEAEDFARASELRKLELELEQRLMESTSTSTGQEEKQCEEEKAAVCICGHTFESVANFCMICGVKRPLKASESTKVDEDVPKDTLVHRHIRYDEKKELYWFRMNGEHFQVTLKAAGNSIEECARISQLCWAKMDSGVSKEETLAYRETLYRELQPPPKTETFINLRGEKVVLAAPGSSAVVEERPPPKPWKDLEPSDVDRLLCDDLWFYEKELKLNTSRPKEERVKRLEQLAQKQTLSREDALQGWLALSEEERHQKPVLDLKKLEQIARIPDADSLSVTERRARLLELLWKSRKSGSLEKKASSFFQSWCNNK